MTPTDTSQGPGPSNKDRTIWAAVITATAVLIAALIGLFASANSPAIFQTFNVSGSQASGTSSPPAPLPTATATSTVTVTVTPSTSPASQAPPVRHRGVLVVDGSAADLDATNSDPTWGRNGQGTGDGIVDGFSYSSGGFGIYTNGRETRVRYLGRGAFSYLDCADEALHPYATGVTIPVGKLAVGAGVCIKTSADRYALATVTTEGNAEDVTLDVTVWELAG